MKWFRHAALFCFLFMLCSYISNIRAGKSPLPLGSTSVSQNSSLQSSMVLPSYEKVFIMNEKVKILYFEETKKLPLFQMNGLIKIGSKDDPMGKKGIANLLVNMLNVGSKEAFDLAFDTKKQNLGIDFSVDSGKKNNKLCVHFYFYI